MGCTPIEACNPENFERIREYQKKYIREFERKNQQMWKYIEQDNVLIKNEKRQNKDSKLYDDKGVIVQNEYDDVYLVKKSNGKIVREHACQLRAFKNGDVGFTPKYIK